MKNIIIFLISTILLSACCDKLDIQQAYDFSITTMPVQKKIKRGEIAEIRCQLNKAGNYKEAKFYIGYFQQDGKGVLKMDDGTIFLPNDIYPLKKETFRLYYTSECTDQQTVDLTVTDGFGKRYDFSISFTNDSDKEEK